MRLKSFYAKTMKEAMQMVRDTLGDDAVIVATKEERGGKSVRVTAAVDRDNYYGSERRENEAPARRAPSDSDLFDSETDASDSSGDRLPNFELGTVERPAESREWLQYDEDGDEAAVVEQLTDAMLRHGTSDEVTDQVISCATVLGMNSAKDSLIAALEHLFSFRPLPKKPVQGAFMIVGPPGAGKTLAVAKLATRAVLDGMRPAVITTDTIRAGGLEQLAAFTKLLRVDLQKAKDAQELRECLKTVRKADQVFIDTGGLNPFSQQEMRDLARLISAGDIEPVLAMPAGLDADEAGDIARSYGTLGVRTMIPTRLDIARRLGGVLSSAHHGGMVLADASHTPKVADGLIPMSPETLARYLMPQAFRDGKGQQGAKHDGQRIKEHAG